jgi:hypothetical protein
VFDHVERASPELECRILHPPPRLAIAERSWGISGGFFKDQNRSFRVFLRHRNRGR